MYTHTFFEAIDQRCIDINLESNPFPELCVVRSLITAVRLDYRISRRLAKYIYTHARGASAEGLEAVQISHYGTVKCRGADLLRWASDVGRQLQTKVGEVRILVSKERTRQIRDNADLCMLE